MEKSVLTKREKEVFDLLVSNKTTKEISKISIEDGIQVLLSYKNIKIIYKAKSIL